MESVAEASLVAQVTPGLLPRFQDGAVSLQELLRQLAESIVSEIMDAEVDHMCTRGTNSRDGYLERKLQTRVGTLALKVPKLRQGSFFPADVLTRCQRADGALVAAVAETCATGTGTRMVQKVARKLDIERLSGDQAGAMAKDPDTDVEVLRARDLGSARMPYSWPDAAYVKCRREGRVASTALVTAVGADERGWRHALGISVVGTESYDSWLAFLKEIGGRGIEGVRLVTSDAHEGLRRAIREVFQGAAWQRCVAHLMRGCAREASSQALGKRVARVVAPVFRAKDPNQARAMYRLACEMPGGCCPKAARVLEEAEPDALACLDLPKSHWKRLRTSNVQEGISRETRPRSKVVRVFPSVESLTQLVGAVMCEQDDEWSGSRYLSEERISELYEEMPKTAPPKKRKRSSCSY